MKAKYSIFSLILCIIMLFSALNLPTKAIDVTDYIAIGMVNTTSSSLNVRSGPGTNYEKVGQVQKNSYLSITGIAKDSNNEEWYRIDLAGTIGYVKKSYIKLDGTGTVPTPTPVTTHDPNTTPTAPVVTPTASEFEESIKNFPESYKVKLRELHKEHPTWKFIALDTKISWDVLVKNQCVTGRNLLQEPDAWKSFDEDAYDWKNSTWYSFDSGNWNQACTEVITHYLDPRNFLDKNIYQFLVLSDDGATVDPTVINQILKNTFMYDKECDTGLSYAEGIIKAAKEAGASPYMLVARLLLEQGSKGNSLAHGYEIGGKKYYNHFDIGAYAHSGNSAIYNGAVYAKGKGWDTAYKALVGGAKFLVKSYVGVGQNTLYLQKYDVVDGGNGFYGHQYMTNVLAAVDEGATLRKTIESAGADKTELNFLIPVYKNMPDSTPALPLKTGNANNLLSDLKIEGKEIKFDKYQSTYEIITDDAHINITATPSNKSAKVEGAGKIALQEGVNEITITVTATNGLKRQYHIIASSSASVNYEIGYNTTETLITGVEAGATLEKFKEKLTLTGYTAVFTDASGKEKTADAIMKTGDFVKLSYNGKEVKTFRVVIYGDSTGDGKLTSADLLKTQKSILGIISINDAPFKEAADFTKDGKVNSRDLLACQKRILGLS